MDKVFKGQEILKLAVRIEINGFEFYKETSGIIKDVRLVELFNYLADEEVKHKKTFESILENFGNYTPFENYPGEYDLFLKNLAGENIFTKEGASKTFARKATSKDAAIDMAIGFERDSITFFSEMKNLLPADAHRIIDQILEEENRHLSKLTELKNNNQ